MKRLLLTLFSFILFSSGYSQTWERAYGFIPNKEEGAYTICKLTDGNFIAAGYAEGIGSNPPRVVKINPLGDTLWSKVVILPNMTYLSVMSSLSLSDGGFLITGSCKSNSINTGYAAKLDLNGNRIWSKEYSSNGLYYPIIEIIKGNDNGFICTSQELLLKIDDDGNYQWHRPSSYYGDSTVYGFKSYDNNSYIGESTNFPNSGACILKINNTGEIIWQKQTHDNIAPEFIYPNSDKLFTFVSGSDTATHSMMLKLQTYDTSGNFILEKRVSVGREERTSGLYLSINPNRFLISSGNILLTQDTFYCALRILDSNLNIIRSLDLTTKGGFRGLYSAVKQDEKYILAAGNISLHLGYGYEDFYIIKTDTNLNMLVSIGIRKLENETPKEFSLYQNYPNPFNPETKIKFSVPGQSKVNMSIYDITGKMVQTLINRNMQTGTYEITWDASQLPSGTYFCRMTTDKFTKTIKLVLLK